MRPMHYRASDGRWYDHKETPEEYRARHGGGGSDSSDLDWGQWSTWVALGIVVGLIVLVFTGDAGAAFSWGIGVALIPLFVLIGCIWLIGALLGLF